MRGELEKLIDSESNKEIMHFMHLINAVCKLSNLGTISIISYLQSCILFYPCKCVSTRYVLYWDCFENEKQLEASPI